MSNTEKPMVELNLLDYPIVLSLPAYHSGTFDWLDNIPFGNFVMQATQPSLFVELGVCHGDSYMAFCQAATQVSPRTSCVGIDAWEPTMDFINMAATNFKVQRLFAEHERYAHFSKLVKKLHNDAVGDFADASIDLLHVDGDHLAARDDYDLWLPKMSSRGVMLFHDVTWRGPTCTVPDFWEWATRIHPSFLVPSRTGLGLLAIGDSVPDPIVALCSLSDPTRANAQKWFRVLGSYLCYLTRRGFYEDHNSHDLGAIDGTEVTSS